MGDYVPVAYHKVSGIKTFYDSVTAQKKNVMFTIKNYISFFTSVIIRVHLHLYLDSYI